MRRSMLACAVQSIRKCRTDSLYHAQRYLPYTFTLKDICRTVFFFFGERELIGRDNQRDVTYWTVLGDLT